MTEESTQRRRDDEFWFEDGSVNLIAGDVEFRFYKGLLGSRSPVFKDMFSMPQPPEVIGAPTPSGLSEVPTVHLTDTPEAFRELLRALFPDGANSKVAQFPIICELSPEAWGHPTAFTIASCVRLGHKYQIDSVVEHCLRYLRKYYPSSLDDYNQLWYIGPPEFVSMDSICVVNLARLTGATSIIPTAIVDACFKTPSKLMEGFTWPDGSHEALSSQDLARCLDARILLMGQSIERVDCKYSKLPATGCKQHLGCQSSGGLLTEVMKRVRVVSNGNPFVAGDVFAPIQGLCPSCLEACRECDSEVMKRMWADLPETTGVGKIPGWGNHQ